MKKRLVSIFVLASFIALMGCESKQKTVSEDGKEQDLLTICVIHNNADHPSITAIVQGMDDEASKYNAEITYFDPAFDPQKQAAMIEDSIAIKPDVIIVNCVDPVAVIPAVKKAYDNSIPVIVQNARIAKEGEKYTKGYIGSQALDQGYAVGKMMSEKFENKNAKVVILGGKPGQSDYVDRVAGAKKAWTDKGVNYTIIADQPAEWSKDKALTLTQDLLTRYTDGAIDAIFAVDDPMAIGAIEAIKAAGRKNIAVYGVNGNIDAFKSIKAGEMEGTALQLSYLVGVYTVRAAYDVKVGRLIPELILAPTAGVTKDNLANWEKYAW